MAFTIKLGDLLPAFTATLKSAGAAYDITGYSSVTLRYRLESATTVTSKTMTVVSATAGTVSYAWQAGDLPTVGHYVCEIRVMFGAVQFTFPNSGSESIEVKATI